VAALQYLDKPERRAHLFLGDRSEIRFRVY
jgi:hypothetical protein